MSESDPAFDPAKHLTRINGNEYLEVRWRVKWLRDDAPDSQIITEMLELTPDFALFRATVTRIVDAEVVGVATGHGSETAGDFRDYIEKAEQKSIGRALAHLGYGTQFVSGEAAADRPVDAPVDRSVRVSQFPSPGRSQEPQQRGGHAPDEIATQRQLRYLQSVAREAGIDAATLDEISMGEFGVLAAALTRRDASTLIDNIQTRRQDVPR